MDDTNVTVTRYRERFTTCASCRAEARWLINGTTACDRHRPTWERRAAARSLIPDMTNTAPAAPIAAPSLFCECPDPECMPLHHAPGTPCGCVTLFDPDPDAPAARGAYLHPLGHDGTGLRGEAHIVKCDNCNVVLNSGHRYYADRSGYPGYGNLHLAQALADHHNRKEH